MREVANAVGLLESTFALIDERVAHELAQLKLAGFELVVEEGGSLLEARDGTDGPSS